MKLAPRLAHTNDLPDPMCSVADPLGVARRLHVPVWVYDIEKARVPYANGAACELWEAKNETELRERDMGSDMSSTVEKRLKQYQADFLDNDSSFTEMWTLYPNGIPRSLMVVFRGFVLPDGRMAMLCEGVGETDDMPQNLRSAEALLHTDVMITLFSKAGPPLYLNPAARNTFVNSTTEFESIFVDDADYKHMMMLIDRVGEHRMVAAVQTLSDHRWYDLSAKLCSDAVTGQPAILLTAFDVSELKDARDTASKLAERDQLTNLYNRAYLQSHLTKLSQNPDAQNCAIVFFDIDRFKMINDRFGHDAGDTVLKQMAKRATDHLRQDDLVARLGGDEFVVLLENVRDFDEVMSRTDRLCAAMSRPILHDKTLIDVAISVGISQFNPATADFNEVLREADIALYRSKQMGRNRSTVFTAEMGVAAKARDDIERELKYAVERDEFILHYQPRLDLKTGKVVSVEGLVRWEHPKRGLVMPNAFIGICEETGLIEKLGTRVLEMGCAQAIAWHRAGLDVEVSLNASPRQFADEGFFDTLAKLASLPGFPAGKIELEITESVLSGDPEMIAEKLRKITTIGYRIAIDDFGTGYSNLSYISRFPLNCLKIDQSFIHQLPDSGPIISLILTLGQQIGATVVSEGVETREQLAWLTENQCDQAQGYLITAALPVPECETFMKATMT